MFRDDLVRSGTEGVTERFFDRFVFNLHPADATTPCVLIGHGLYPGTDTADGFAILVTPTEQRNLRWSTQLSDTDWRAVGPFRFDVVEPNLTWRLTLASNPSGLELDVMWTARAPYWAGAIAVGEATAFEHLFQSGRYQGTLTIDGAVRSVDGWFGQRDRSRGVRTMAGGQGLHVWFQAQFPDRSVGFLFVESRDGTPILTEGAVMQVDGTVDSIVDVRHDLRFNDLDLVGGRVVVRTASGQTYEIVVDARAGGGFMAGGGYGGHHGRPQGIDHLEQDTYPLDGSVTPRTLDSSLTDRMTVFDWDGVRGIGIFEFALSRSRSYSYHSRVS
jgi:hypothetical protein